MNSLQVKIVQRRAALFFVPIFSFLLCLCMGNEMFEEEVLGVDVSDYYEEKLKFDEEGNLLMTTHDLKATSGVTYRTLGWIIKRYDMPIDAPGQQYAVITLRRYSDIEYRDDPGDSRYVYCYYYGDKSDILGSIKNVDVRWFNQLNNYGDYVYIDEVMTVCENGVPKGSLDVNGKATGEVYFTCDGITNARHWASPASLKTHYDKTVKFPALVHTKKYFKSVEKSHVDKFSSGFEGKVLFGHGTKDKSLYDISKGVPAGEILYMHGKASRYLYNIDVNKVDVTVNVPVKIITTYHLKWTDYYGVERNEDKRVARWYLVERKGTYWKIDNFNYRRLTGINIQNKALSGGCAVAEYGKIPDVDYINKAGYQVPSKYVEKEVDGGYLYGKSGIKPVIPDEDQSGKAEAFVGKVKVTNDYLKIDNVAIVDNGAGYREENIQKLFTKASVSVYEENLRISPSAKNWSGYRSDGKAYYMDADGKQYEYKISVNDIAVLTPVACKGNVSDDKAHNQCINPDKERSSLTIGRTFYVGISTQGSHNSWKGYGTRDYAEYAWKTQIRIPFDVFRAGKRVEGGTWMDVENGIVPVAIPVGTKEGKYTIRYRVVACNAQYVEDYDKLTEQGANLSYSNYIATDKIEVNVVGRIHNLTLGDSEYKVGVRDCDGIKRGCANQLPYMMKKGENIPVSITTDGDFNSSADSIIVNTRYYYIDSNGKRRRLKAFTAEDSASGNVSGDVKISLMPGGIVLDVSCREFTGDTMKYKAKDEEMAKQGRQVWRGSIHIPDNIFFVGYNTDMEDGIYRREVINKKHIEGNIIINFDITAKKNGKKYLSYINKTNSSEGYCNMWKIEEGLGSIELGVSTVLLSDGDSIIYSIGNVQHKRYIVAGTH